MLLKINDKRSVEISELTEKDALIWASAVYLGTPFPDNFDEMTEEELYTFIEENGTEESSFESSNYIYQKIDDLAWYLLHSIKK